MDRSVVLCWAGDIRPSRPRERSALLADVSVRSSAVAFSRSLPVGRAVASKLPPAVLAPLTSRGHKDEETPDKLDYLLKLGGAEHGHNLIDAMLVEH